MNEFKKRRARKGAKESKLSLRNKLWPELLEKDIWTSNHDGFRSIPRGMPLIMEIMDDLSKGKPISHAYLEIWCHSYDECLVNLKHQEMAFQAGFTGQRGERTWKERVDILNTLRFINLKGGAAGANSYALIYNPYLVIRWHYENKTPGLLTDKYNALMAWAADIGAPDFEMPGLGDPDPPEPPVAK